MARDPYDDHNQLISLLLSTLFLLLLTHGVTYFRTGPLSAGATIDRFNIHSAEVSTLYPHYENRTPIRVDQRRSDKTDLLP